MTKTKGRAIIQDKLEKMVRKERGRQIRDRERKSQRETRENIERMLRREVGVKKGKRRMRWERNK